MQRYTLKQGKLREDDAGKWVKWEDAERLQAGYDYTGIEARSCPGCVYEEGTFIRRCKLHERIDHLQAIVDKLPKDAGGVSITIGMTLWYLDTADCLHSVKATHFVEENLDSVWSDGRQEAAEAKGE